MKLNRDYNKIKSCPRCGMNYIEGSESCSECGLIFSRLEVATNKDAKKKMLRGDRDFIIKVSKLPSDVSFIKLLLLSIFLGEMGVHCFYVGRYYRGGLLLGNFIFMMMLVIFNRQISEVNDGALLGVLSTICGFILLAWLWDIFMIITKKFKVPVAIDIEGDREEYFRQVESDLNEIKKDAEEGKLNTENINENKDENLERVSQNEGTIQAEINIEEGVTLDNHSKEVNAKEVEKKDEKLSKTGEEK